MQQLIFMGLTIQTSKYEPCTQNTYNYCYLKMVQQDIKHFSYNKFAQIQQKTKVGFFFLALYYSLLCLIREKNHSGDQYVRG